jgi:hypothetical protein
MGMVYRPHILPELISNLGCGFMGPAGNGLGYFQTSPEESRTREE